MKNNQRLASAFVGALALAIIPGAAHAENALSGASDGKALLSAKLSIAQAIQAAESQSGGKAASADFNASKDEGGPAFEVEVITPDGSEQQLAVNAETGVVTKTVASKGSDEKEGHEDIQEEQE